MPKKRSPQSTYESPSSGGFRTILKRLWDFTWKATLTLLIPLLLLIGWYAYQASQYDLNLVQQIPARTVLLDRNQTEIGTRKKKTTHQILRNSTIPPNLPSRQRRLSIPRTQRSRLPGTRPRRPPQPQRPRLHSGRLHPLHAAHP